MATLDTSLTGGNGAAFNNQIAGVCDLTSNASFSFDGSGATAIFNNFGLVSNGVVGEPIISVPFTNAGKVQIQGRGITFGHGFDLGYTQISGSTTIAAGAALELAGATAVIQGGTLSGTGLVDGALTNMAIVHPGFSPGVLTVNLLFGQLYAKRERRPCNRHCRSCSRNPIQSTRGHRRRVIGRRSKSQFNQRLHACRGRRFLHCNFWIAKWSVYDCDRKSPLQRTRPRASLQRYQCPSRRGE